MWPATTASEVMIPLQKLDTTGPDRPLWPVVRGNGIVGMISREDILHYLRALRAVAA
jgi:hypothetical protein